ncbi:hypothetical protein [Curtobacterium flaccumfaciens]|uniref:hypothetical protein n=1 Tax=Curtobacterium flaccumfaciens TaxID=2035 RepID=UPI001E5746A8|nr:hypothetical protein [Curtobacterium allii]MCE0459691.1 hypothetical protein [Curtobacterium allii]
MHPDLHPTHHRDAAALATGATITVLVGVVVTIAGWGTLLSVAGAALTMLGLLAALVVLMLVRLPTR